MVDFSVLGKVVSFPLRWHYRHRQVVLEQRDLGLLKLYWQRGQSNSTVGGVLALHMVNLVIPDMPFGLPLPGVISEYRARRNP